MMDLYVKSLILQGANPDCTLNESWRYLMDRRNCLYYAIGVNKFNSAKALIENGADVFAVSPDYNDEIGPFPFLMACYNRNAIHILRFLLDKGIDINIRYQRNESHFEDNWITGPAYDEVDEFYSPMLTAVRGQNNDAIELLVAHGYSFIDWEIIWLICTNNDNLTKIAISKAQLERPILTKYLLTAITADNNEIVEYILSLQEELVKNEDFLDEAVSKKRVNIIRTLIRKGANAESIGWLRRKFLRSDVLDALNGK